MNATPSWGPAGAADAAKTAGADPAPSAAPPPVPAPPAAPPTAPVPALPDGYGAQRVVAADGRGTVVLCRQAAGGREVSVRVLAQTVDDAARRLAAHSELLAAGAAARHPCAVTVMDAGFTAAGQPYVVEEFCPGGSAQDRLDASGPLPVEDVLVVGVRLALALHSSHRRGVLHLDVRPANVLYDARGEALLAGHALGRVLQRAVPSVGAVFDPAYAAREMFGWEAPGPAADVYALGATLYALLAGESPHAGPAREGRSAVYEAALTGGLPRPSRGDVPEPLYALLYRMTAPHAEGRPPLTEVHGVLRSLLPLSCAARVPDLQPEAEPATPLPGWNPADDALTEPPPEVDDDPDSAEALARRRRTRNRVLAACGALLLVAGAGVALFLVRAANEEEPAAKDRPAQKTPRSAHPLPKGQVPDFQAQEVKVTRVGQQVQVVWDAPKKPQPVYGYAITAQSPDGETVKVKNTNADEPSVVFSSPPVKPGSCYVVTSLVQTADGSVGLASAEAVCDRGESRAPAG
ncbi:serine/threonine protein kinase [Streptomyces albus subsp. chlorinus]|uniref:serine/threonine-protein kinase n=1 Tax=Streptomyces albus TaxID=1888 RepID=UPI00156F1A14|nr:serine/threonine-protein kinase [Streptomyces albus]NSC24698.1 serine/threonine protein kinase [Streptomyces albus subsp. chlorinus]